MPPRVLTSAFLLSFGFIMCVALPSRAAVREIATISTNFGDMEFELFSDVSPRAVANFKYLADTRFYDSTAFHRHIAGFMVQGGDPYTRGTTESGYSDLTEFVGNGGPEYTIPNEPTKRPDRAHVRGVLSMAKTTEPDSAGSQFFIMFGTDKGLDDLHAPMGRMLPTGESVLARIEQQPKDAGKKDRPISPILINSIRIRAVFSDDQWVERILYKPGTYSGLLKGPDRNQDLYENLLVQWNKNAWNGMPFRGPIRSFAKNMDAKGSFQISVTRGGAFSARIQYYGRLNSFSGALTQSSLGLPEASFVTTLDPSSPARLRVRIHARKTNREAESLVLRLNQIGPQDSDLNDGSAVISAMDLAAQSNLSDRYTVEIPAPTSSFIRTDVTPADPSLSGSGYLLVNVRNASGIAFVLGRLPDNTPVTFSRPVSNEGGRLSLPIYFHELQPEAELQRADFNRVNLSDWYALDKYFHLGVFRNRFVGVLELPPNPKSTIPKNENGNWLLWIRPESNGGVPRNRVASYLVPTVAPWTPPAAGVTLPPFVSGVKGLLSVGTMGVGRFQLVRSNTAAVFDSGAFAPQIRFNPADGSFSGSFWSASSGDARRRTFQGALLQKDGINKGVGFSMTQDASVPVVLSP
jgi:peptidyl-prolyl cis-trans isomerase B (cyclophilin B)